MWEFLKIAWRNLFRNPRRTIIISCAIAIGIWGVLMAIAIDNAFLYQMVDNFIYTFVGHIEIHAQGYHKNPNLKLFIPEADSALAKVKSAPHLAGFAPRINAFALAQSPRASQGVILVGIDPEKEASVTRVKQFVTRGKYFEKDNERSVLIGESLARELKVGVGDRVTFYTQGLADENGIMESLPVVGTYRSGISALDKVQVYLPLKTCAQMLQMQDKLSEIAITVDDPKNLELLKAALKENFSRPITDLKTEVQPAGSEQKTAWIRVKSAEKDQLILDPDYPSESFRLNPAVSNETMRLYLPIAALAQGQNGKQNYADLELIGVDPINENKISGIFNRVEIPENSWLQGTELEKELEVQPDWIILSEDAAQKLGVSAGDTIHLDSGDKLLTLTVAGKLKENLAGEPGKNFGIISRDLLWRTFISRPCASEIIIQLKPEAEAGKVAEDLIASLSFEVLDWKELYPILGQMSSMIAWANYVFLLVIYIAVSFGIANTMIMSVFERVRELGIMKAIGTTPGQLFVQVILESVMLALLGMILGGMVSAATIFIWDRNGLDLSYFAEGMESFGVGTVLYPVLTLANIIIAVVMAFAIAIISALYPAYRASRISVQDALRRI